MKRLVHLLSLAVSSVVTAQTPDSTVADRLSAPRPATMEAASVPPMLSRPTWRESVVGVGGLVAGGTVGVLGSLGVVYVGTSITCKEEYPDEDCLLSFVLPISAGYIAGTYTGVRFVRNRYNRGSRGGAMVGFLAGSGLAGNLIDWIEPVGPAGTPIMIAVTLAGGIAGGAAGFRYGPGAKGTGRPQRVALVPMATPNGGGVYAIVRF